MDIFILCCWGGDNGEAEPYVTTWPSVDMAREHLRSIPDVDDPTAHYFIEKHKLGVTGCVEIVSGLTTELR